MPTNPEDSDPLAIAKYLAGMPSTSSVGSFEKFVFPMIRQGWPNLVSADYVSSPECDPECETCKEERQYLDKTPF